MKRRICVRRNVLRVRPRRQPGVTTFGFDSAFIRIAAKPYYSSRAKRMASSSSSPLTGLLEDHAAEHTTTRVSRRNHQIAAKGAYLFSHGFLEFRGAPGKAALPIELAELLVPAPRRRCRYVEVAFGAQGSPIDWPPLQKEISRSATRASNDEAQRERNGAPYPSDHQATHGVTVVSSH